MKKPLYLFFCRYHQYSEVELVSELTLSLYIINYNIELRSNFIIYRILSLFVLSLSPIVVDSQEKL
jgi:hypothetical protein